MFAKRRHRKHEVTCTNGTGKQLFARHAPDMGYQSGSDVMSSLLPLVTHMQIII
jgi:hypothetical protein